MWGMDVWVDVVSTYRIAWISGRVGLGKTSLAYLTAEHFLKKGYRLVSNNRNVWNDEDVKLLDDGTMRVVVILDEGGLAMKVNRQVERMASYPAKMDMVYLIPSYWPPARAATLVRCHGLYTLRKAGLPWNVYRWTAGTGVFKDTGLLVVSTKRVYGIYDRQDPSARAYDIVDWCDSKINDFLNYHGYKDRGIIDEGESPESIVSDAVEGLAEVLEGQVIRVARRGGRGR